MLSGKQHTFILFGHDGFPVPRPMVKAPAFWYPSLLVYFVSLEDYFSFITLMLA
jgi:hypothetical protein